MTKQSAIPDPKQQRASALRTIWVLAGVALSIYVAFILHAVLAK
jgi:hypothetical protein